VKGIAKGMVTTFRHFVRPAITEQYPLEKRTLPERSRMSFGMHLDAQGSPECKACLLCEKSCPDEAIVIDSEKRTDGPGRVLTRFSIDLGRCMYCGICVEQCSTNGLHHTGDYETCSADRADTILVLYEAPTDRASAPELDELDAEPVGGGASAGGELP